jgi:hypothetical protein
MAQTNDDRITLRGLNSETLKQLDRLVERRNYSSRSELICDILDEYVACNNEYTVKFLPKIVRSMVSQEIKRASENSDEIINDVYKTCLRLLRVTQKFENFLYPELEKFSGNDLNTQELLAIIEAMEKSEGYE